MNKIVSEIQYTTMTNEHRNKYFSRAKKIQIQYLEF